MQNYEFDIDYIHDGVFSSKNNIRAYCPNRESKILPNKYNICCTNLPQGTYSIKNSKINFHFNTRYSMVYGDLFDSVRETYENYGDFSFKVLGDCEFMLQLKRCKRKDIEQIVISLREQAVKNQNNLQQKQESLIQKDIKSHTDLGEEYNRESFYATLNECAQDEFKIEIDPNNTLIDADTISLHSAKLIQDQIKIAREKRKLFNLEKRYIQDKEKLNANAQSLNNQL
ncbi:MAG: hypothetical protein IJ458_04750 [Clostridia bacterium]|nr:hypothetical protein [Clostridia bacterium]